MNGIPFPEDEKKDFKSKEDFRETLRCQATLQLQIKLTLFPGVISPAVTLTVQVQTL